MRGQRASRGAFPSRPNGLRAKQVCSAPVYEAIGSKGTQKHKEVKYLETFDSIPDR